MKDFLLVGLGGMFGSMSRYLIYLLTTPFLINYKFPWATFIINIAGCCLLGMTLPYIERLTNMSTEFRLLIIVGFLGGFTTFSAFGLELVHLIKQEMIITAIMYSVLSVIFGVIGLWLGMSVLSKL